MFLLDTNVVSELRKVAANKADPNVSKWANSVNQAQLYISSITVMEIEIGILQVERKHKTQGSLLRDWFEKKVLPTFSQRTLNVDSLVALRCAKLHVPNRCTERDALLAATALVHGMIMVTRNTADFKATKVPLLNPWK